MGVNVSANVSAKLGVTSGAGLRTQLEAALAQMAISLTAGQVSCLLDYVDLLLKWNKVYNLTAVRDPQEMLTHHLLDCLAALPSLAGLLDRQLALQDGGGGPTRLLDVGSGAGLPGVVIAICCPEVSVDCVDTVAKKAAFINQAALALKLPNLRGLHQRVEIITSSQYQIISARAFASLPDIVQWTSGALAEGGVWMCMKGKTPDAEMAGLPKTVEVFHVEQLAVPGLDASRCLVWMRKSVAV